MADAARAAGGAGPRLKSTSAIKASQSNVVQQAKLLDEAGSPWHAVKYGNLEMITRLFPSQSNVYQKGPVGENVFHIALLLNTPSTLAIAKYLVKLYGKTLVNTPYQERKHEHDTPGLYEGETALHIAIVNRDFDMVKFLIQSGAEVRARCYGGFFQLGSPVYYGEYPLSFAAATGQKDIVSYLKRHGARVNHDCDMYGNTALHVAVVHEQLDMYDHLVEYCGAWEHVRNNRGATPLLLAASMGKMEVFQHIYNRRRKVAWAYGPVTSYSLSLYEIDTVRSRTRVFVPSAIETIVRKGHMHMIDDPLVKTLLTNKWRRFARAQWLLHGLLYLVLVLLQTFLVWLLGSASLFDTPARAALEIVTVVMAVGFVVLEAVDVRQWVLSVHRRRRHMKAATVLCPPLYPIPGEQVELPGKSKSGFLTRLVKGATAEGTEPPASDDAVPTPQERAPLPPPLAGNAWWGADAAPPPPPASSTSRAAAPGPVAEAGAPSGSGKAPEEGGRPARSVQIITPQSSTSSTGPSGGGNVVSPAAVKPAIRTAGNAIAVSPFIPSDSGAVPPPPERAMNPALRASRANLRPDNPRVADIVSVGLGGSGASGVVGGAGGPMPAQRAPSFFVQQPLPSTGGSGGAGGSGAQSFVARGAAAAAAAAAAAVAEGGQSHGGIAPLQGGGARGAAEDAVRPGGGSLMGAEGVASQRKDGGSISGAVDGRKSMDSIVSSNAGEIKNRIRGGGGGDYQAGQGVTMRREAKAASQPAEEEEAVEDTREPLHVRGLRGTLQLLQHSLTGYYTRQTQDPVTLVMACHLLLTLIHFITWASAYGGVRGPGPGSAKVAEFDDIIVSLMSLAGWTSVLYFARGVEYAGQLAVMVELCVVEVVKYCTIYLIFNIGFTLAFYTVLRGTYYVTVGGGDGDDAYDPAAPTLDNIGFTMIQLLRFMYGEADYSTYSDTPSRAKLAVATCYFIIYIAAVLLLLGNLLTAVILVVYQAQQGHAQKVWLLRWASYVLRAEARMPLQLQHTFRLGEVSYDPALQARVYNHVFEVVEEPQRAEERDKDVKALEALLERLKKGGAGGSGGAAAKK